MPKENSEAILTLSNIFQDSQAKTGLLRLQADPTLPVVVSVGDKTFNTAILFKGYVTTLDSSGDEQSHIININLTATFPEKK